MKTIVWQTDDFEKDLRKALKEEKKKKVRKQMKKGKFIAKAFLTGCRDGMLDATILTFAGIIGLNQGLKYSGNWKRGLVAGLATDAMFGVLMGIANVGKNLKQYKS